MIADLVKTQGLLVATAVAVSLLARIGITI